MNVSAKKSPPGKFPALCAALFIAVFAPQIFADSSYTVKKGDTLYSISRRYELTVAELRTANNLSEADIIKEGQILIIPQADISNAATLAATEQAGANAPLSQRATETYVVAKGDTLYSISRRYGMQLYDLLGINNMPADAVIMPGQRIQVFAASDRAAALATAAGNSSAASATTSSASGSGTRNAAQAANASTRTGDSSLLWPVENPQVTYTSGKVSGVELSAQNGEAVKSIRAGTVMYTGLYRGYGNIVFVESKTGLIYAYSWLGSVAVKKGDYVVAGDTVGTAGRDASGNPGLTFMVFQNGMPIDPATAPRG